MNNNEIMNKAKECSTFLIEQENGLAYVRDRYCPPTVGENNVLDFSDGGWFPPDRMIIDLLQYKVVLTEFLGEKMITKACDKFFGGHIIEYTFKAKSACTGETMTVKGYTSDDKYFKEAWSGRFIYKGKYMYGDWELIPIMGEKAERLRQALSAS